jgi:hypothetical protein
MRNILGKSCRENKNTHFMFSKFFRKSCRLLDNAEECGGTGKVTDDNVIQHMGFSCWVTKATCIHANTRKEYLKLTLSHSKCGLREHAPFLRFTFIVFLFLVRLSFFFHLLTLVDPLIIEMNVEYEF